MTCDARAELLLLLAAGALDEPAGAELRAHLDAGCPRCAGAWVEAQATLAHFTLELAPVVPSPDVRDRLMERVASDAARQKASRAPKAIWVWLRPALAAGVAAAVAWFAVVLPRNQRQSATESVVARQAQQIATLQEDLDASRALAARQTELQQTIELQQNEIARLERQVSDALKQLSQQPPEDQRVALYRNQIATHEAEIARLRQEMIDARRLEQTLGSPGVEIIALSGAGPGQDASARIFWDRQARVWHFYAAGLPDSAPGRTYALWFITGTDRKIPAGLFDVDNNGNASLTVELPQSIGAITVAAVTDEPIGGMPQPTGAIHLAGQVQAGGRGS